MTAATDPRIARAAVGAPCLERKRATWLDYARRHNIIG
jgi:hypothetical protein